MRESRRRVGWRKDWGKVKLGSDREDLSNLAMEFRQFGP